MAAQLCSVRAASVRLEATVEWDLANRCQQLMVRDTASEVVAGRCSLIAPPNAREARVERVDRHFDLALLIVLRERMVEIGRPLVNPHYRFDNVAAHLWSALARYLIGSGHDYVLASAPVPLLDGGHAAASIHRLACVRHLSPEDYRVFPRLRLPHERLSNTRDVTAPPLLQGYLDLGAWICGEPALVPERDRAEFPVLLPLARMQSREARRFLAQAT